MKRQKNAPANESSNGTAPGVPAEPAPEAAPEEKLAALQAERDDTKDRMLRIAAEFENFKKRARKDQTDAVAEARERVLKDMLEVVDYLERAVAMQPGSNGAGAADGTALVKGV